MPDTSRDRRIKSMLSRLARRVQRSRIPTREELERMFAALAPDGDCPPCPRCGHRMLWSPQSKRGMARLPSLHCDNNGIWAIVCVGCRLTPNPARPRAAKGV